MERSVNTGLVALATSDLFLCLVYFIASLHWNKPNYDSILELYYRTYQELFINFFLLARSGNGGDCGKTVDRFPNQKVL